MSKLQKQQFQTESQKFIVRSIHIKVKFACRWFMEYQINQQALRTKEIRVDSRNTQYQVNQPIQIPKQYFSRTSKRQKEFRIMVKLLSGKGLSFTVGHVDINQSTIFRNNGTFQVKVSQTQDIQARCTFEVIKTALEKQFKTPNKQNGDLNLLSNENINDTNSSKSNGSKLEIELQQLRKDYNKLKDKFSKYEETNFAQTVQKFAHSEPRKVYEDQNYSKCCEQQRQRNRMLQGKINELQRQLSHSEQLFNKQKDILRMFQINLKEKSQQYEQLRKRCQEISKNNEQLYKNSCNLQQQKIQYLMGQLKNEKQKNHIGEYMAHMFEQIYRVIENIFKQRISNITSLAQSKQINKKQVKKQSLTTPTSPVKKLFYSTDLKKCQQNMENCIVQDISMSGGELQMSEIHSMNKININEEIVMKNILKDFQPKVSTLFSQQCIQTVKEYCFKIQKFVNHSVEKLFKKIMELSSYNQACKKKLNEDKQQYQDNEQSLIDYLQQLQEGLQTQLEIAKERDTILKHDENIIQTLNQILLQRQRRIRELQQAYDKLEDEKNQVRAQLHQNNYIYAIKEEQLLKKIYELQTGFQKPEPYEARHQPTKLRILQRKPTVLSDNYDDCEINQNYQKSDEIYENEIIYQSPKLSSLKEDNQQILPQRNQYNLYEDSAEAKLRHTMLKNHRQTLVNKLRQQMANAENAESIDQNDQQHKKKEKVIEEEFLKVLV